MVVKSGFVLCLAYVAGLFSVSLWVQHVGLDLSYGSLIAGFSGLALCGGAAIVGPRYWRLGPSAPIWILAGVIALLASLNYWWQYPVPTSTDISQQFVTDEGSFQPVKVWGKIQSMPKLTRSDKGQFWLQVQSAQEIGREGQPQEQAKSVSGKLYVTLPREAIPNLYPGQAVSVQGQLYQPSIPKNPNGFDFAAYLRSHRTFAGLAARWVNAEDKSPPPTWRLWRLRQRIVTAHQNGLGIPAGPLVSAMALGRSAVALPYDIQDAFIQAGLAHTLAASGFHVSLVLGVVLGALKYRSDKVIVISGCLALLGYITLTGAQPSILRASLMGGGALIGLALKRKVSPLGCLLGVVTLLLLWNPLWIDNVGFRLSVMATFGLIVTATALTVWLDWLPGVLASLIAVPIAAYLWTVPLQMFHFNTLTTYSILLNVVATPLVIVLSLGGIVSGLVSAFVPGVGSFLAWLLWIPAHILIALVNWEVRQPGSSLAVGQISLAQMMGIYSLFLLIWLQPWCRKRRWFLGLLAVVLALGPLWYQSHTTTRITVLAADAEPILVLQGQHKTLLINGGQEQNARYTVAPFLQQAGINRVDWAIALPSSSPPAWNLLSQKTPIETLYSQQPENPCADTIRRVHPLTVGRTTLLATHRLQNLDANAPIFRLIPKDGPAWLLLPEELSPEQQSFLASQGSLLKSDVLWWTGNPLQQNLLDVIQPQVAIASALTLSTKTEQQLQRQGIQIFLTERDGAVIWTARHGFQGYLHAHQTRPSSLD